MIAAVFGSSGGIGRALVSALLARGGYTHVFAISRSGAAHEGAQARQADFLDAADLAALAEEIAAAGPLCLAIVASGLLSDGDALQPEKTYRHHLLENFQRVFEANTFAPGLIAKHMLPLMPKKERGVFAALSARVGSITDNRLGGWHAYRASKAALNMLIRNYAIEQARRAPGAICVGLHPGTVDTGLSRPFQSGVSEGKLFTPDQSAGYLLDVIGNLTPEDSGKCFDWAGKEVPA
ncbi:oxidoreductase, short chain dehydrogenase/reductase family [Hyphomonas neptunium ATCC 15444]|uniref:Oxidoreductase, short chain dehydrogenase/reductase family n=2 Tax=Hyphomonas TaxID=85 RepID=Q0BX88_HYPNA|nr:MULTISPECIES: SDR family NAD(P)-dependent oxidoreductase [Hyphomonas]ABI75952.1 oxidoreductase, short chain dehydrogenase/reductase family [Hyphomonas neptunium ATCC 15444]